MNKKYLFLMLGAPGSGKSYFAENLTRDTGVVHVNSDAMRLAIFKSRAETYRIYHSEQRSTLNTYTFGALNYAATSVLKSGSSVIYDANNNSRQERLDTVRVLELDDVTPIIIWVQTPFEEAVRRAQERRESDTQRQLSEESARAYITKITSEIEVPGDDELVIKIDGTVPFEQQYESFKKQLAEIEDE